MATSPRPWLRAAAPALLAALAAAGGDDEPTRDDPPRTLDHGSLRAVYLDLYGRPPFDGEREAWLGRGRAELVDALLWTEELWERWVEEQLYYFLLVDNFRPHAERVQALPADLAARRLGVRDAIHRIALSASFDRRNPGPDTFVSVVMEQLLGLTVQDRPRELAIGKRLYDGHEGVFLGEEGRSQADVIRIAVEHEGFLEHLLRREHRRLLRAEPSRRDLRGWTRRLEEDPVAFGAILREWLLSEAYERRLREEITQPNRLYVRAMYVDLMGRLPAPEEERRMRAALDGLADPAPLRAVLARLLLDSGDARVPDKADVQDPTAWVAGLFERLLGRPAGERELETFVASFHEEACRPETVVYALVSHPEYQTY